MPTNEERREVARMLRNCSGGWSSGECYYTIIRALGLPDTSREDGGRALYDAIADLIEPEPYRTCRNDSKVGSNSPGWLFDFKCSECGAELCAEEMGNSPLWVDGDAEPISYCPNCGSKVIE